LQNNHNGNFKATHHILYSKAWTDRGFCT